MGNTQLMSIKLPRHLGAKVARLAKRQGKTRSQVVRDALEAYPEGRRFGDVAGRFAGIARGLPSDLSTNPKHLEGYGRGRE